MMLFFLNLDLTIMLTQLQMPPREMRSSSLMILISPVAEVGHVNITDLAREADAIGILFSAFSPDREHETIARHVVPF